MNNRLAFSVVVLFLSFACHRHIAGSTLSNSTTVLVTAMESDSFIGTESIGRIMDISPEYTRRQTLMTEASTKELVGLIRHENPVIGLSAFEGLVNRAYPDIKPLLDYFAESKRKVHYIKGDLSSHVSTLEYAYFVILDLPLDGNNLTPDGLPQFGIDAAEQAKYIAEILAFRESMNGH